MKKISIKLMLASILLVLLGIIIIRVSFTTYAATLENEKQTLLDNVNKNNKKITEISRLQNALHEIAELFRNSENYNNDEFINTFSLKWTFLNEDKMNINILNDNYQERIDEINKQLNNKIFMGYFELTAYAGDTITSTGKRPKVNHTIAVDPRVIPYGSKVLIEGYGTYIAEDCGGAIKGNIIDIFLSSEAECRKFGRQHANVYIIKN